MKNKNYESIEDLLEAYRGGEISVPKDGAFYLRVEKHSVHGIVHPGWYSDGEELGDPEYIFSYDGRLGPPPIVQALEMLGFPTEEA